MSIARAMTSPLRIRYMSDLHLEFSDFTPPPLEADIVVLAGDIHTGTDGLDWAARSFPETPVLYLPGNHEYYGFDLPTLYRELAAYAKRLGIQFMNNQEVIVGDVRIIGSTLWTDFELLGPSTLAMLAAETGMNDYQQITHGDRSLLPIDTKSLHDIGRYYLECKLEEPFEGKTVVLTHHAPSLRSIPADRQGSQLAAAYASDLESLTQQADVWIHGHIHARLQYQLGRCLVLCNPRGYKSDLYRQETGFDERAIVEV